LEAMACNTYICAHDNIFNKSILGEDASYFKSATDVAKILNSDIADQTAAKNNNIKKIKELYSWETIVNQYESLFQRLLKKQ
jgi:glycosyltransferase involved in cell wall biosynthesis